MPGRAERAAVTTAPDSLTQGCFPPEPITPETSSIWARPSSLCAPQGLHARWSMAAGEQGPSGSVSSVSSLACGNTASIHGIYCTRTLCQAASESGHQAVIDSHAVLVKQAPLFARGTHEDAT